MHGLDRGHGRIKVEHNGMRHRGFRQAAFFGPCRPANGCLHVTTLRSIALSTMTVRAEGYRCPCVIRRTNDRLQLPLQAAASARLRCCDRCAARAHPPRACEQRPVASLTTHLRLLPPRPSPSPSPSPAPSVAGQPAHQSVCFRGRQLRPSQQTLARHRAPSKHLSAVARPCEHQTR